MKTIRDLFQKPIDRRIEEVIKVDQDDETAVSDELDEYVLTESIAEHFRTVYKAIADAPSEPHEGIGIWVSGFFGSGKSSFAKILGYTVSNRSVRNKNTSALLKEKALSELPKTIAEPVCALLDVVNSQTKTYAIIFDVSMDRGVRTANERITEIMYKALLRSLDYSEDFDLAELEMSLEADGKLEAFSLEFESQHGKPWKLRRKLGLAINEASATLHRMNSDIYSSADSWAKSLGQGRADINPNMLAERAFELAERRKPGHALIFIIDEVGQYVSRSVDKMLDLQAVIQAFGREGKNRVRSRKAPAPCWIVVTAQEKLNEVVDALDSRKIELARLQDRFPNPIDLKQSDISEVTSRRVLNKSPQAASVLTKSYADNEGRLKSLCSLERTSRNCEISQIDFVNLYPYLPYQIDLCIDIVSGLRLRRGAQRHIGGSNRTIIKQAQQILVHPQTNLAAMPIGDLVTLDLVYNLLHVGNLLPTEVTREVDDIPSRLPNDPMAHKVAKAISLLEVVTDLPRTARNLAVVLHPNIEKESQLQNVEEALKRLENAQVIRESEDGFKLLTIQEKNWDTTRKGIEAKRADRNRIKRELLDEVLSDPGIRAYRYQNRKSFPFNISIDNDPAESGSQLSLRLMSADISEEFESICEDARKESNENPTVLYWVFGFTDELDNFVEELHRSREMISTHERLQAQNKLSQEDQSCLADEKVRRDRLQRQVRSKLIERLQCGAGFFQGVRKDASALGQSTTEIFAKLRDEAIPAVYPKFDMGNRPVKGDEPEKVLTEANLNGLPAIFYDGNEGLNLVVRSDGKSMPNLNAEICREVMDYIKREHSYGNKVTGKVLDAHFQGVGFAWERDILRVVLAVLLRGGAIEVTHQGRKYRNHTDPACRPAFINNNAFRAASFAPREAIDLRMLTDAARHYEEMTGNEVDIEEGALSQAFKKLAEEDGKYLARVVDRMKLVQLPGIEYFAEFQDSVSGIIDMATDDCVKTLAGEGKTYREARLRLYKVNEALTELNLETIRQARVSLKDQLSVLLAHESTVELEQSAKNLEEALSTELFYEYLKEIRDNSATIRELYSDYYSSLHSQRNETYSHSIESIKGLSEWSQVAKWAEASEDEIVRSERQQRIDSILDGLHKKQCQSLDLPSDGYRCRTCQATASQMETEIAAVDSLKSTASKLLQELAQPEKKIVRVRLSSVAGNFVDSEDEIEHLLVRLREHLLKLLAEDARVMLE